MRLSNYIFQLYFPTIFSNYIFQLLYIFQLYFPTIFSNYIFSSQKFMQIEICKEKESISGFPKWCKFGTIVYLQ